MNRISSHCLSISTVLLAPLLTSVMVTLCQKMHIAGWRGRVYPRKQFLAILRLIAWKVGNVLCSKSLSWSSCVCGRPLFWLSRCGYVHSLGNFVSIVFWLTPKDWASTFSCNRANSCWFSESYVILIALHMYNKN